MPDNIQFIYGELIKIHRAGLLVCALISLNQQTIYSALMCSSRRANRPPSSHVTHLTLILMHANKQKQFWNNFLDAQVIPRLPVHTVDNYVFYQDSCCLHMIRQAAAFTVTLTCDMSKIVKVSTSPWPERS